MHCVASWMVAERFVSVVVMLQDDSVVWKAFIVRPVFVIGVAFTQSVFF